MLKSNHVVRSDEQEEHLLLAQQSNMQPKTPSGSPYDSAHSGTKWFKCYKKFSRWKLLTGVFFTVVMLSLAYYYTVTASSDKEVISHSGNLC